MLNLIQNTGNYKQNYRQNFGAIAPNLSGYIRRQEGYCDEAIREVEALIERAAKNTVFDVIQSGEDYGLNGLKTVLFNKKTNQIKENSIKPIYDISQMQEQVEAAEKAEKEYLEQNTTNFVVNA